MEKNKVMEHISNEEKARELSDKYKKIVDYSVEQCLIEMAEWKDEQHTKEKQQLIEKACEWLFKNTRFTTNDIRDFKKAMEK